MVAAMEEVTALTYRSGMLTIVGSQCAQSTHTQLTNTTAASGIRNERSTFSASKTKPSLGVSYSFTSDVEILLENSAKIFGLVDAGERERASKPGLRVVMEVLKSRVSVRHLLNCTRLIRRNRGLGLYLTRYVLRIPSAVLPN